VGARKTKTRSLNSDSQNKGIHAQVFKSCHLARRHTGTRAQLVKLLAGPQWNLKVFRKQGLMCQNFSKLSQIWLGNRLSQLQHQISVLIPFGLLKFH